MKVENHRLITGSGINCTFKDTPNQSGEMKPKYLVVHFTSWASVSVAGANILYILVTAGTGLFRVDA